MVLGINDPILIIFLIIGVLVIFALYLMARRTVLAFKEGTKRNNR
jgi:hypothetical protein